MNKVLIDQIMSYYQMNNPNSELKLYFKYENVFVKGTEIISFLIKDSVMKIKEFSFDYE